MATEIETVGTSSRDYADQELAEADLNNTTYPSAGTDVVHDLYNDSDFDDNVSYDFSATNVDSVTVKAADGEGHNGTAGTGVRNAGTNNSTIVNFEASAVNADDRITYGNGIEIDQTGQGASFVLNGDHNNNNRLVIVGLIIHSNGNNSSNCRGFSSRGVVRYKNCLGYDFLSGGSSAPAIIFESRSSSRVEEFFNCTADNATANSGSGDAYCFEHGDHANKRLSNCLAGIADGSSSGDHEAFEANTSSDIDYCLSDDATADGGNSLVNKPIENQVISVTVDSEDYRLKTGADAIDAGEDLSGSGVSDDAVGTSRPQGSAYDIGFFEFISAASVLRDHGVEWGARRGVLRGVG